MATSTPWADRSGDERRSTFARFGILYTVIFLVAIALSWVAIAIIFGLIAVGLGVAWYTTEAGQALPEAPREKPAWMQAMDDPDAPDKSLPEYRTTHDVPEQSNTSVDPEPRPCSFTEPGTPEPPFSEG